MSAETKSINNENTKKLCDLLFVREAFLQKKFEKVLIENTFIKDDIFNIITGIIRTKINKFKKHTHSTSIHVDAIRQLYLLDQTDRYVQYMLFYCENQLGQRCKSISNLISYIKLGGTIDYKILYYVINPGSKKGNEYYQTGERVKLLELLSLLNPVIVNRAYIEMASDGCDVLFEYNMNIITKLQNDMEELKKQHEEEIKELLMPGNLGAKAAESRFKELSNINSKSSNETGSLDD